MYCGLLRETEEGVKGQRQVHVRTPWAGRRWLPEPGLILSLKTYWEGKKQPWMGQRSGWPHGNALSRRQCPSVDWHFIPWWWLWTSLASWGLWEYLDRSLPKEWLWAIAGIKDYLINLTLKRCDLTFITSRTYETQAKNSPNTPKHY